MNKAFLTAGLLVFFVVQPSSNTFPAIDEIPPPVQSLIDSFFEKLTNHKIEEVLDFLDSHMVGTRDSKQRQAFFLELSNIEEMHGKYLGLEKLYAEYRGQDLIGVSYLYKCEDDPLIFYFVFYRPKQQWMIDAVFFNDAPDALFDRS